MASVLKRKRGSLEVFEAPKRAKSTQRAQNPTPVSYLSNVGSTSAPLERQDGLTTVNGISDYNGTVKRISESPEGEDYEEFIKRGLQSETQKISNGTAQNLEWHLSAPIGGRMIDVDPVFTEDEK
jgi:NET1-associated nuclear protein 1 (U3 small nucleolar RNA-associated protein 17)